MTVLEVLRPHKLEICHVGRKVKIDEEVLLDRSTTARVGGDKMSAANLAAIRYSKNFWSQHYDGHPPSVNGL